MDLRDRTVLVLGLGESGLAMARWCLREGARVRVADTRLRPPMVDAARALAVDLRLGSIDPEQLDGIDAIAISPGLSPRAEPQRALLDAARARAVPVLSEIELFAQKLSALKAADGYAPRVVAITGTNGKTTVTKLVGRLCEAAGRRCVVAGNVSPAALDALADAIDTTLPDIWVLELSSFQLETTTSLAADVATVLNVTQDHLDWHGDMTAYTAAKRAIFAPSTVRVLNRDDAIVMAMAADGAPCLSFGLDAPRALGDFGVVREGVDDDALRWLAVIEGPDPETEARGRIARPAAKGRRPAKPAEAVASEPPLVRRLMPADALRIRGDHNVANTLAALALGRAIGLPMGAMLRAAASYLGEPHRMQQVATIDDVDYVEDSKGTNVGATVAALSGLGRRIVLIAGGDGKGQDFAPLSAPIARHARAVVLIGRDRAAIRTAVADAAAVQQVDLVDADSLEAAVSAAARLARPGDVVLLSPACASLDMFRDYKHRADVFVDAVHALASTETASC